MYNVTIINIPLYPQKIGLRIERDLFVPLLSIHIISESFHLDTLGDRAANKREGSKTLRDAVCLAPP